MVDVYASLIFQDDEVIMRPLHDSEKEILAHNKKSVYLTTHRGNARNERCCLNTQPVRM